jgi:hypothetical protein
MGLYSSTAGSANTGTPTTNGHRKHRHPRSPRRHFRHGQRAAAVRAITAARLYLSGFANSFANAADQCGSSVVYVRAAVTLLRAENASLLNAVLGGKVPLLAAAREMQRLADLVAAYRTASASDRVAFAHAVGPTTLFENALVPAM